MHPRLAACLALLPLAACGGGESTEGGGGSGVTWLAEGSGPSNAEPLWPVRPGWTMQGHLAGRYAHTYTVLDARTVGGRTVTPLAAAVRGNFEFLGVPSEPAFYRYLAEDAEGLWFFGQPKEGLLDAGALLVPREVKVGMKWTSRVDGDARFTVEVTGRETQETNFGPRTVWTLAIADERRFWYEGPDLADSPRRTGATTVMRFAEGRGPISDNPLFGTGMTTDGGLADHLVVPLGDAAAPVTAPAAGLRPIGGGARVFENFLPIAAGAYPDPSGDGSTILAVRGFGMFFGQAFAGDMDNGAGGGATSTEDHALRCARLRGDTIEALAATDERCAAADGLLVTRAGETHVLPSFSHGIPLFEQHCPVGSGSCIPRVHFFRGLLEGDDGRPLALSWSVEGRAAPPGSVSIGRYEPDFYVENTLSYPDGFETWPTVLPFLGIRPHFGAGPASFNKTFWWLRRLDDGHIALADVGGLSGGDTGRIAFSRLEAIPRAAGEHYAFPAMEVQSAVATPGGHEYFLFGYEGLLRRVHLARDGIELEAVAQLAPPEGDFLSAAFVVGDEVIALSQRDMKGADPWFTEGGIDRTHFTSSGDVYAWRAPLPAAGARARPSPIFGVEAQVFDKDVRVCWAPGGGPADEDSFTLGGAAPAAVIEHGPCVLLVRAAPESHEAPLRPGAWAIEGEVPGAGRVAIALSPDVWRSKHFGKGWEHPRGFDHAGGEPALVGAPLAGGGMVSTLGVFGPGLISGTDENATRGGGRAARDAAGHGLWTYRPQWSLHGVSLLHRDGETVVDLEPYVAAKQLGGTRVYDVWPIPVVGGGVLVGDLLVRPDGGVTDLPVPAFRDPGNAQFVPRVALADGTVCASVQDAGDSGHTETMFTCVAPDGTARSTPHDLAYHPVEPGPWAATASAAWTAIADEHGALRVMRVDLATLERTDVALPGVPAGSKARVRHDARGTPYFLFTSEGGTHALFRLEDGGPAPIDVPELALMRGSVDVDVVVDEALFLLVSLNHRPPLEAESLTDDPPDVLRVPRAGR